jgi:hypothetical protein
MIGRGGYGDYEWLAPLINAVGQIVVVAVKAATTHPQTGQPQCSPGYVFNATLGGCITEAQAIALASPQGQQSGTQLDTNTLLIAGGIGLGVLLLLSRR